MTEDKQPARTIAEYRSAIRCWLEYGAKTLGRDTYRPGHSGYFSQGGWAFETLLLLDQHLAQSEPTDDARVAELEARIAELELKWRLG